MSWLCEYCSTYNPDESRTCYVCNAKKSMKTIRAARRLARKEAYDRLKPKILDGLTLVGKIAFLGSIIVYSIVALISLYLIMQNGRMSDIIVTCIDIVRHAGENVLSLVEINLMTLLESLSESPVMKIGETVMFIAMRAGEKLNMIFNTVMLIGSIVLETLKPAASMVFWIIQKVIDSVRTVVENVYTLIDMVMNHIHEII